MVLRTDTYVMTVVVVNISKVWRLLRSWPRCYSRKNEYTYISTLSTLTPQGSVASSENIGDVKLRSGTGEVNCQLSAACKHCKHCKQLADWQIGSLALLMLMIVPDLASAPSSSQSSPSRRECPPDTWFPARSCHTSLSVRA